MIELIGIVLLLIVFYAVVIIFRFAGIGRKTDCPSCRSKEFIRVPKSAGDHLLVIITFRILPLRRYKCLSCGWSGLRWKESRKKVRN